MVLTLLVLKLRGVSEYTWLPLFPFQVNTPLAEAMPTILIKARLSTVFVDFIMSNIPYGYHYVQQLPILTINHTHVPC
ncbi:hypothetical protein LVJ82_04755 [Vitreoscilla massiliensis]|uniref:Uncharacterized protein n=1 Tax=Vitreoscilla massiliensis TaxID=1689272 RepID=A0ABY4E3E1_9NEIS|nr:hypothetical protein [Vitreoscilla massiliensis]UOO90295.1 hypothetical protein LVJ82_04755 [Vitreoscilla massiliensis]